MHAADPVSPFPFPRRATNAASLATLGGLPDRELLGEDGIPQRSKSELQERTGNHGHDHRKEP